MTPEKFKEIDTLSLDNIRMYRDVSNTAVKHVNNIIFIISSGTFVASISFIGYLKTTPKYPWLLIFAWVFFFSAICGNVIVHYLSAKRSDRGVIELNNYRKEGFEPFWNMVESRDPKVNLMTRWANRITFFVFSCIFFGMAFLIAFGAVNILNIDSQNSPTKQFGSNYIKDYQQRNLLRLNYENDRKSHIFNLR
ncbi:MAG: hypothetical protein QG583_800 [Patescibacteria group bacterium]|nr:hypothetical protein [Patescibacteria group bacterium]